MIALQIAFQALITGAQFAHAHPVLAFILAILGR